MLIEKEDAIKAVCEACYMYKYIGEHYKECKYYPCDDINALEAIPSAEQVTGKLKNPCDSLLTDDSAECKESGSKLDLISRADAIEAVIAQRHRAELSDYNFALGLAEDAIRHIPSADAVSMEEHVKELNDLASAWKNKFVNAEKRTEELYDETMGKVANECKTCKERLQNLRPSAEAVQGWIPCSERLPKVGENVLFTTDIYGGYVAEGDRRADGKWWQYRWNALLQNDEVTAWMPLPTPYKGGEDE